MSDNYPSGFTGHPEFKPEEMTQEDNQQLLPKRIWICPSGNNIYSSECSNSTPEMMYIRADLCAEPSDDTCTGCLCLTVHHTCGSLPDAKSVTDDAVAEALAMRPTMQYFIWCETYQDTIIAALTRQQPCDVHCSHADMWKQKYEEMIAEQPCVPTGWKLVPIEPTPTMMMEFYQSASFVTVNGSEFKNTFPDVYRLMIAAAPDHTQTKGDE